MGTRAERAEWLAEHAVIGGIILNVVAGLGFFVLFGAMQGFRRPGVLFLLGMVFGFISGPILVLMNRKQVRVRRRPRVEQRREGTR